MQILLTLIAHAAHLATLARVLAYRRVDARHRTSVSWVAWAFIVVIGGSSIELASSAGQASFFEAATAILLAVFVYRVRGNVAQFLRSD